MTELGYLSTEGKVISIAERGQPTPLHNLAPQRTPTHFEEFREVRATARGYPEILQNLLGGLRMKLCADVR